MTPNQRITAVRKRLRLTQAAFAAVLKLKQGYISELEAGKSKNGRVLNVSENIKQLLFDIWGVNISWLMNGPDELAGELMFHKNKPPTMYGPVTGSAVDYMGMNTKSPNTPLMIEETSQSAYQGVGEKIAHLTRAVEMLQDELAFHRKIIGGLKDQIDELEKRFARLGEVRHRSADAG